MDGFQRRRGADGARRSPFPSTSAPAIPTCWRWTGCPCATSCYNTGLDSEPLHWYVNYACRDDYGCRYDETSAWMGIHYFASRDALARDADSDDVLTWPEGNGWLVEKAAGTAGAASGHRRLVWRLSELDRAVLVDAWQPGENRSVRRLAQRVIWAAPVFQAPQVFRELSSELAAAIGEFQYAPWLVANLSLRGFPEERRGAPLAWDNVLYDSDALGYVVATHQHLAVHQDQTVFTWYHALSDGPPERERQRLLATPWAAWAEQILRDLSRPHPDIRPNRSPGWIWCAGVTP